MSYWQLVVSTEKDWQMHVEGKNHRSHTGATRDRGKLQQQVDGLRAFIVVTGTGSTSNANGLQVGPKTYN